jgi:cell division protein FtsW
MAAASQLFKGDRIIWVIVLILSLMGVLAVYSATSTLAFSEKGGDTEFYFLRHSGFLLMGLAVLYVTHRMPYAFYKIMARWGIYLSIALLVLTLAVGHDINNAARVLPIPFLNLTLQPSDMAKLFLVLYIARVISKNHEDAGSKRVFYQSLTSVGVVVLLIAPENLSTGLMIFVTSMMLMYIGRVNLKLLGIITGIGITALSLMVVFLLNISPQTAKDLGKRVPTWKSRIETFMGKNPDAESSYQQVQSQIAVATGGVFGKGPGHSTQRYYLPHPYSDFIYAIIMEEYGLIGGLLILSCFLVLLFRCLKMVTASPQAFGALTVVGLGLSMSFQAFLNMGVAVGVLPVTGLTIPLVSMGGTSLLFNSLSFGIILGISRHIQEEKRKQAQETVGSLA